LIDEITNMNARAEDFIESDYEKGTLKAEFPTPVQLMNDVYMRETQTSLPLDIITYTSSGDLNWTASDYTDMGVYPAEPDPQRFGSWLQSYHEKLELPLGRFYEICTHIWSGSDIAGRDQRILFSRRSTRNKRAVALLQSWIDEAPDDQQAKDLQQLKEEIDDQRMEGRKLFS